MITKALINTYKSHLKSVISERTGKPLSNASVNLKLSAIRKLVSEAADNGLIDDLTVTVEVPEPPTSTPTDTPTPTPTSTFTPTPTATNTPTPLGPVWINCSIPSSVECGEAAKGRRGPVPSSDPGHDPLSYPIEFCYPPGIELSYYQYVQLTLPWYRVAGTEEDGIWVAENDPNNTILVFQEPTCSLGVTPTPTPSLTPTATIDPNITPTPSPTPGGDIQGVIDELDTYGVTAYSGGLPDTDPSFSTHAKSWTLDELQAVLDGVHDTAVALNSFRNDTFSYNEASPNKVLFQTIMKPITVLRVENGYMSAETAQCDGTLDAACTSPGSGSAVLTFYGDLTPYGGVDKYTTAHELGHLFNVRSGGGNGRSSGSLYGRMHSASVNDYDSVFLFGASRPYVPEGSTPASGVPVDDDNTYDEWTRGTRGWGSGPASAYSPQGSPQTLRFTSFQKNSFTVAGWAVPIGDKRRETEIDEATADMFLNWVYRHVSGASFMNRSWHPDELDPNTNQSCSSIPEGCPDETRRPGDKRFDWMQSVMQTIFTAQSWN